MSFRSPVRILGMTAAAAVGVSMTLLAVPAAQAAPVFVDATTQLDPFADLFTDDNVNGGTDCTFTQTGGTEPTVAVAENGPAATVATTVSGTFANAGDGTDNATASGAANGSAKVATAGGTLTTMDFSAQSNAQLSNALGGSPDCYRSISAGVNFNFDFTVAQAGFLTLKGKNVGTSSGGINLFRTLPNGQQYYVNTNGSGLKFNSEVKVFLDAGTYGGNFQAASFTAVNGAVNGTTSLHGDFAVAGSQIEKVSGKGKKFVSVPTARSCATHTIVPSITNSKNRVNDIKQVTFFINDKVVKKVNTPNKGADFKLSVGDDTTADLVAQVKLFPAKKGKPGKVYEASASYEACS